MEHKTDPLPTIAVFQNASDQNSLDYYDQRIADAEYKILLVQHDEKEISKAIKNGWFENAEKAVINLKKEKEEFINNNK